jgi:aminoglycoside/choline kinase family phosphotransferase
MSQDPTAQAPSIVWTDAARQTQFTHWLTQLSAEHALQPDSVRLASADASFRRYFRIHSAAGSRIIMDAPPDRENCQPFVQVAALMQQAGLLAPEVLAWDQTLGFMLLTDLGGQTMMQVVDVTQAQLNLPLYLQAVDALIRWQLASRPGVLPAYDATLLRRELELFPDWYLKQHKSQTIDAEMRATLDKSFAQIIANNLSQPAVFVHRDFMPRNLMAPATPGAPLGVLDFQDAVYGPITYDIASLMRDAFLSWDEDFCLDVTVRYWQQARQAGLPVGDDFGEFYRAVEWMGLQRHLKVAGIFARLTLRDGKPQYLADTPRFIHYIRATCSRYRELKPLLRLIDRVEGIVEPDIFGFGRQ